MHRHCLRSALLQCTEPGGSCHPFHASKRLHLSTSSSPSTSATYKPKQQRSRGDKPREKKPAAAERAPKKQPPKIYDRRAYYLNKASADRGLTKIERIDPTQHTPVRFISPKPLLASLLQSEKKSFVGGDTPEATHVEDVGSEEELPFTSSVTPGSFVEVRTNERSVEGVVLGDRLIDGRVLTVILASSGEITATLASNIYFAVPNIISLDLTARCGIEAVPETPQALNARVEALKLLRVVSIQAEQAAQGSRMWDRQNILKVYEEIKHHDPTKWATVTLEHVTALFYVQPGYINYYATHKYLMERPLKYIAETGYIRNQTFRVRPERDVKEIQTVEDWIMKYRVKPSDKGPYKLFIQKARRVVAKFLEQPPRDIGDMSQEKWIFAWNEDDRTILSYLLRSLQQHTSNQLDPYRVGRSAIVKDILKVTVADVTDDVIHRLLIQLRVIAPWQDLHALSSLLNPSGDFGVRFPIEQETERLFRASSRPQPTAGAVLGPLDLRPSDPLDSVRHDFGDLRVFVIDDPTAAELDDGISVERIPTEPENHWVHVHIADPARHLHPGHALSHMARTQYSSLYFVHSKFPMFPTAFMHDPNFALSLTDTTVTKQPNYVLTFSAKLDGQANILDYKLRAGILHNVRKTTYDDVDFALGESIPPRDFPFGGTSDQVHRGPTLSEADIADLRIIKKLAWDQVNKRRQQNIINLDSPALKIEMQTPPDEIHSPNLSGSVYHGFPEMKYSVTTSANEDRGSRGFVSEMMKLSCRIASRVGLDHNIPLIRRAIDPFVYNDFDTAVKLSNNTGYISHQDFVKIGGFATSGQHTQQPAAHALLGLPAGEGYTRASSPLRRYSDLAMHWQLHHILLGLNAPPRPPFSSDEMEKLIVEASVKDIQYRRLEKANLLFHALTYIKRFAKETAKGVERPSGDPLARMKAWTLKTPAKDITNRLATPVTLPELGVQAFALDLPSHFVDLPPGSDLVVKYHSIELGLRRTKMFVTLTS